MYTDVVFPRDNEKDFVQIAKKLGYKRLIFCYKDRFPDDFNYEEEIAGQKTTIEIAKVLDVRSIQPIKKQFTIFKANQNLREAMEKGIIDVIYGQEELEKRDKIHFRLSGLNHVLCKIARENSIIIGFSFSSVLNAPPIRRAIIIGRMLQNIRLCRKYKLKMLIGSFATKPFEMRQPNDLASFGVVMGMHPKEAREAVWCQSVLLV